MWKLTLSMARTWPEPRPNMPARTLKSLLRPDTSSSRGRSDRSAAPCPLAGSLSGGGFIQETPHAMVLVDPGHRGHLRVAAAGHEFGAARVERAARQAYERPGDGALDGHQALPGGLAKPRHGLEQINGVGMLGIIQNLAHRAVFD